MPARPSSVLTSIPVGVPVGIPVGALAGVLVLSLALPLGCVGHVAWRDGRYQDDVVRYSLEPPGEGWRPLEMEQANLAWTNPHIGAAILVNSHCKGVEDAPLDVLTRHLLMGMTDVEILSERVLELSRREALETTVEAKLDGRTRRMRVLVLKKAGCVYDVVLDASPEGFSAAVPAYERVRHTLDVQSRKDWS